MDQPTGFAAFDHGRATDSYGATGTSARSNIYVWTHSDINATNGSDSYNSSGTYTR